MLFYSLRIFDGASWFDKYDIYLLFDTLGTSPSPMPADNVDGPRGFKITFPAKVIQAMPLNTFIGPNAVGVVVSTVGGATHIVYNRICPLT
jgi:hypothetical protein